jgi:hypothetical protein
MLTWVRQPMSLSLEWTAALFGPANSMTNCTVPMKKRNRSKRKPLKKKKRVKARRVVRRPTRPRQVQLAIRRLLDTTNHIQARAAELENALDALREQERSKVVKELLLALRNSSAGDLLRFVPAVPGGVGNSTAQAIVGVLVEAFSIAPIHNLGERIPVRDGEIPDSLELDRSIGDETEKCVAAEVVSVGWNYKNKMLLKPVVRPVFGTSEAASLA